MRTKREIRETMIKKRTLLTNDEKKRLDNIVFQKVINSSEYKDAKVIFLFVSYKDEIDTHRIIEQALRDEKIVCVPKTISMKEGMNAIQIKDFQDLVEGNYGILEPKNHELIVKESIIDVSFLPGLAFDERGGRVGYGGGFYDRFLIKTRSHSKKIGIGYSFQVIDEVPMEKHDMFIDGIITD
ncbi:5-formyltetrahydrofolate cyclo-ligase [Clostridium sp. DJ247]|uniref:5-formyltetrahydrofolate cyclo-ligase n=1 Tax=Clostridium sp. DJ247 TaxID=2726188 RepID=UPI0016283FBE|nr:5-formyltetrahydrofolate cyclo-ligase [Clostridium sp. DJ247]MBC2582550.1 5-formyltetrahydrofolate cyclo-ligase [Clostridium sp. DJ247]